MIFQIFPQYFLSIFICYPTVRYFHSVIHEPLKTDYLCYYMSHYLYVVTPSPARQSAFPETASDHLSCYKGESTCKEHVQNVARVKCEKHTQCIPHALKTTHDSGPPRVFETLSFILRNIS